MRIGLVSQYFAPEVGATQNRMAVFAAGLAERGHEVVVVCEQPNHPGGVFQPGWGRRPLMTERSGRMTIHRLWVATSPHKTPARRVAFYGSFAAGAMAALLAVPKPDVLMATSPPLPGAWAAALAAQIRRIPFVLDVRDLWPAAASALGEVSNPRVLRILERGERWIYGVAERVTATTQPFCRHIDHVAAAPISVHLPNGALDSLLALPDRPPPSDGFVVGYAGNLGIAQGLEIVLDAAERLRESPVHFRLMGDGPLAVELRREIDRRGLGNAVLEPPLPASEIGSFLQSCNVLVIPLRDHPLLNDFIPSKLYDAMAVGRPVICAAGREASELVLETGCGIAVAPGDADSLADAIASLAADPERARMLGEAGRRAAPRFARSNQVQQLHEVLLAAAGDEDRRAAVCAAS
jgi:glycosyltransferase involved in cell wall biosynthesis